MEGSIVQSDVGAFGLVDQDRRRRWALGSWGAICSDPPSCASAAAASGADRRLSSTYIGGPAGPPNSTAPVGPSPEGLEVDGFWSRGGGDTA